MVDHDLIILTLERQRQADYREFRGQPGLQSETLSGGVKRRTMVTLANLPEILAVQLTHYSYVHLVAGCASWQACPLEVQ